MTKLDELRALMEKMMEITSSDAYIEEVGFQSKQDNAIVDAINEIYSALNEQ